jgi:hypothetical protein
VIKRSRGGFYEKKVRERGDKGGEGRKDQNVYFLEQGK